MFLKQKDFAQVMSVQEVIVDFASLGDLCQNRVILENDAGDFAEGR